MNFSNDDEFKQDIPQELLDFAQEYLHFKEYSPSTEEIPQKPFDFAQEYLQVEKSNQDIDMMSEGIFICTSKAFYKLIILFLLEENIFHTQKGGSKNFFTLVNSS